MNRIQQPDWGSGEEFFGPRHRFREKLLVETLPDRRGRVLDAACGLGTLSEKLSIRGFNVTGMDQDMGAALRTCQRGVPVVIGDLSHMPFKNQSLRAVISAETLEHISLDQPVSGEIWDSLEPGGVVTVSVPAHGKLWSEWDDWAGHVRRYDLSELLELFDGFLPVRLTGYGFPVLRLYETLVMRRLIKNRSLSGDRFPGARRWVWMKKLFGGIVYLLFHLQVPSNRYNTGWIAQFIKSK